MKTRTTNCVACRKAIFQLAERYNAVTFVLTLNKPDFCQLCGARMDLKDGERE